MTRNDVNDYIICLYYLCKTKFHDKYLRVCDILNIEKKYEKAKCNCLTEGGCEAICGFIENAKKSTSNEISSTICKPVERHLSGFFNYYQSTFSICDDEEASSDFELSHEELSDLRVVIDVYICCAALSNCSFPKTNMRDFVSLVYHTADLIEKSLEPRKEIENSTHVDKKYMLCIIDSFELLRQLRKDAKIYRQNYSIFDVAKNQKENIDRILSENTEKLKNTEANDLNSYNQKLLQRVVPNSKPIDNDKNSLKDENAKSDT